MHFPALPSIPKPLQFESSTFSAREEGIRLVVLGAVHGNEVCGTSAILKVMEDLRSGLLTLVRGSVTLVPVTNPLAYNRQQRNGDRNLNRNFTVTENPMDFEDKVANWLSPILAGHDVLLDLHSFQRGDRPFALFGPPNNQGGLEHFEHATQERSLALRLGVNRFVDGWLDTYAKGVANRVELLARGELTGDDLTVDPRYGMGTTECMRAHGGYAVTLECGQHEDPAAPAVAYKAIVRALTHLGLIDGDKIPAVKDYEHLTLFKVIDKMHFEDNFSKNWLSFDQVTQGELIGVRANGVEVRAEEDAYIVFPNTASKAGQEWFYLARKNNVPIEIDAV